MGKFKVGDKVIVDNVSPDQRGTFPGFIRSMEQYIGQEGIVVHVKPGASVVILSFNNNRVGYTWHEDWLIPAAQAKNKKAKKKKVAKPKLRPLWKILKEKVGNQPSTASYALRFSNGSDKIQARDICNARMTWNYGMAKGIECQEIVISVHPHIAYRNMNAERTKQYYKYVKYIVNDSPWADCFVSKRLCDVMRYGARLNLDWGLSQLMGAAIALREGSEFNDSLPLFNTLLKKKYSPNTAFIVSRYIRPNGNLYTIWGLAGGHTVLNREMLAKDFFEFFHNGYKTRGKPMRTEPQHTYSVFRTIARTLYEEEENLPDDKTTIEKVLNDGLFNGKWERPREWGQRWPDIKEADMIRLADFVEATLKKENAG